MWSLLSLILLVLSCSSGAATTTAATHTWPYTRYRSVLGKNGHSKADPSAPEGREVPPSPLGAWLHRVVKVDATGQLQDLFANGSVAHNATYQEIFESIKIPDPSDRQNRNISHPTPVGDAYELFAHLKYPIDPRCLSDPSKWWYRTYDGSCNWLKTDEISTGEYGTARSRDYNQHAYADGINKPRDGPNPRAISNAFFKRKTEIFYQHTPLMLGLVEFIMHDTSYSRDSKTEPPIEVPMPDDEETFDKDTTFKVWRTEKLPGSGLSKQNPRENRNMASTWLDMSALYGSTEDVARSLRSFQSGKMLTQDLKTRGAKRKGSYLPFNTMKIETRTRPGMPQDQLFAGGDPRTNEDWIMLSIHTLFLREHNRLCDILVRQHPTWDDERIYQTARLVSSAKLFLIGNSYQMAYWTDKMPWPRDDGFPLYRQMFGEDVLDINPANSYPWPLVTKNGKPMTVSAEMAVVYRFHEFIIKSFPIKDATNQTIWEQDLYDTGFNATGFIDAGLENILRGITSTHIPNFKSGVEESFRSAGKYRGNPFDIVTWSIVHEREQGLPTFNQYFVEYNKQDPRVVVPIRKRFEDFSSDRQAVADLKRLYKTPNDVDLVVGVQLEEDMFPGTTIPTSALIISLFSLFGMANSDRFSVGFAMMRCLLVDKPWDCHPSNALEDLIWKSDPQPGLPNFRFYDTFWMGELDLQAHGTNLLWRIVTENSEVDCLQKQPLFPVDPESNPLLCVNKVQKQAVNYNSIALTGVEITRKFLLQHWSKIITEVTPWIVLTRAILYKHIVKIMSAFISVVAVIIGSKIILIKFSNPTIIYGMPFLGSALDFQKNPKELLESGFKKFGDVNVSRCFGIKLGSLINYVISKPEDIKMMMDDNPYETKFNINKFYEVINMPIILRKENFATNMHTNLIRENLTKPQIVRSLGVTIERAAKTYLDKPDGLIPKGQSSKTYKGLSGFCDDYITAVMARCMIGPEADNHPELIPMFLKFNSDVDLAMGLGTMLPSYLRWVAWFQINADYNRFRKIIKPIIKARRGEPKPKDNEVTDFMPIILDIIKDDNRASDLVVIAVWIGLRNLACSMTSTLLDINNVPGLGTEIYNSLKKATISNLDTFSPSTRSKHSPWARLRAAMFESIRLCGTVTGPARIVSAKGEVCLASSSKTKIPEGQIATLSSYWTHRDESIYENALDWDPHRFLHKDPAIGSPSYITWGLNGPHTCPGRWFTQEAICILVKCMLDKYEFEQNGQQTEDQEKYRYSAGVVKRNELECKVMRRV
ncbi:hypothetical protein B7494_g374 [Chlorociboria aeruginascens]|nr:hypothetical protein B7494_g374 [Chlorociboria aeruginascens]